LLLALLALLEALLDTQFSWTMVLLVLDWSWTPMIRGALLEGHSWTHHSRKLKAIIIKSSGPSFRQEPNTTVDPHTAGLRCFFPA
jgi:hypothetical protein